MKTFVEYLKLKSKSVMIDYQLLPGDGTSDEMSQKERALFASMKRWHANLHMKEADWKACFEKVKNKLDVKETMEPISEDLNKFLRTKFKAYALKDQFSVCELLEFLLSDIQVLYQLRIDRRDEEQDDEFGLARIERGMDSVDGIHYQKVFLPSAIFFTYLERHPSAKRIELMRDIFSLGSGCRRQENFYPEVTGVCVECKTGNLENVSENDIELFNRKVFRMQVDSEFGTSFRPSDSDDSDLSVKNDDTDERLGDWYNPFDSSSASDESEVLDDSVVEYKCNECTKMFSRKDFLVFHKEIFHKNNSQSKVVFVADPVDMISSFIQEPEPSTSSETGSMAEKVATCKKKSKNMDNEQPAKQRVRRSLRFKE